MIRYALIAAVSMLTAVSHAHAAIDLLYEELRWNDTVVQCGAVFDVVSKGYEDIGDDEKSKSYRIKSDKLFKITQDEFMRAGRSKKAVEKLYNERVHQLVALLEKDTKVFARQIVFCDQKFPGK